ncbi:hypothetical protein GMRT_13294 [Giardia muris]|uniref:Ubiquitin-like domain-containing protein n=1 Tax=Giardia muris TaxID=5742 RepID=A0A4Z1SRK0_GIAMU|nr:hypothetical protein GMRT_13294 [Giardia muris]|eukprot:TNJ26258.1 hypothetical protein GMRT_13294 [Giardia muris]
MLFVLVERGDHSYYLFLDEASRIEDACRVLGPLVSHPPEDLRLYFAGQPMSPDDTFADMAIDEDTPLTYKFKSQVGEDEEHNPVYDFV